MKAMNIDDLIARTKNKTLPECPSQTEPNVLRRLRTCQPSSTPLFWMLPSTGFKLAAAALVIVVTFTSTLGMATLQAKQKSHRKQVARALDFDVFNDLSLYKAKKEF